MVIATGYTYYSYAQPYVPLPWWQGIYSGGQLQNVMNQQGTNTNLTMQLTN